MIKRKIAMKINSEWNDGFVLCVLIIEMLLRIIKAVIFKAVLNPKPRMYYNAAYRSLDMMAAYIFFSLVFFHLFFPGDLASEPPVLYKRHSE